MPPTSNLRVHLDHLVQRESLRWVDTKSDRSLAPSLPQTYKDPLTRIRYRDLDSQESPYTLVALLRKPDFQRETSAWMPEDCVSLLESIFYGLIIPSLIVWKSPDNNFIYLLDGAHRISVMRAWILDDWGDRAPEGYYERHEFGSEIKEAAIRVRNLVKQKIGSYADIKRAGEKYLQVSNAGGSPREALSPTEFERGRFYTSMLQDAGFHVQDVPGDYDVAETSFLKINRSGQPLDDWETTLIENRNSSLARAIMSLANGGTGRYWPEVVNDAVSLTRRNEVQGLSRKLHDLLFVPPLSTPIKDANVPFIASTRYFPKHAYLMEFLPVLSEVNTPEELFERDKDERPELIIQNGHRLISRAAEALRHINGTSSDPYSLSIVPLFYFYTQAGRYVRSSFYAFVSWIMSGTPEDVRIRKTLFSAHRGRFEEVIFDKDISGAITRRVGSGIRAVTPTLNFFQDLLGLLMDEKSDISSASFQQKLADIQKRVTAPRQGSSSKLGRKFDDAQKTTINLREMYKSAIRCEICDGILNLSGGVQYDHTLPFAQSRVTDAHMGRPTHPFCNNQRTSIEEVRAGSLSLQLPGISSEFFGFIKDGPQLSLFSLFDRTVFPDD